MKNKFIAVSIIGIFLRVFLSVATYHSDTAHFYLAGKVIAQGNLLNFYDASSILFNYPPIVYFVLGPIAYFLNLKLAYIPLDILAGVFLAKLFEKPRNQFLAFTLWIFNPINLFATYMMGQFDIIPTFLTILALYLVVKKSKFVIAALLLGLGASFKIFPFLFLVPLALLKDKWVDRAKVILLGTLVYLFTIVPFLNSPGFRATALLASQTTKSFYSKIDISGGEGIYLFPLAIFLSYLIFLYSKPKIENLWKNFFVLILFFLIFTHYHPQWFLWLTPFFIIELVKKRFIHWPLVTISLLSWIGLLTFFDPGLNVRLFSPLFPELAVMGGPWEILGINLDMTFGRSILQTLFVAPALYYIYLYFPSRNK